MPPYRHASMPCQRRLPERPARAACGLCLAPSLDVQTRPANRHEAGDKVERRGEERRGEERRGEDLGVGGENVKSAARPATS